MGESGGPAVPRAGRPGVGLAPLWPRSAGAAPEGSGCPFTACGGTGPPPSVRRRNREQTPGWKRLGVDMMDAVERQGMSEGGTIPTLPPPLTELRTSYSRRLGAATSLNTRTVIYRT